jgi:hypothetical protein
MRERRPYVVEESTRFTLEATVILGDLWAWERIKAGLDFALARNPHAFPRIGGTEVHAVQLATVPPHAVYFTIDEERECVVLEALF